MTVSVFCVCAHCGKELKTSDPCCPFCGSRRKNKVIRAIAQIDSQIKGITEDRVGKKQSKFLKRVDMNHEGAHVKVGMLVVMSGNRYIHQVKKLGSSGEWTVSHTEDEPLSTHNEKAKAKSKAKKD